MYGFITSEAACGSAIFRDFDIAICLSRTSFAMESPIVAAVDLEESGLVGDWFTGKCDTGLGEALLLDDKMVGSG